MIDRTIASHIYRGTDSQSWSWGQQLQVLQRLINTGAPWSLNKICWYRWHCIGSKARDFSHRVITAKGKAITAEPYLNAHFKLELPFVYVLESVPLLIHEIFFCRDLHHNLLAMDRAQLAWNSDLHWHLVQRVGIGQSHAVYLYQSSQQSRIDEWRRTPLFRHR